MEDRGHYRAYIEKNFHQSTLEVIRVANEIIQDYDQQGLDLTVRQLYYQFVARDIIPNSDASYNRLQSAISDGRLAGLISWTAIEDRTRNLMGLPTKKSPRHAVEGLDKDYRRDLWETQEWRPEVWVEKEALAGVISGICNELRVDFFACRGYNSQSEQWRAGQRFAGYVRKGQRPIVLHLGDHDPSGLDMTRDNRERLEMFAGTPIMVQRLALNMNQIDLYKPPPNPAKTTDIRFKNYSKEYNTNQSWELDSLSPSVIRELIREAIMKIRDQAEFEHQLKREKEERQALKEMIESL